MPDALRILGVRVDRMTYAGLLEQLDAWIAGGQPHQVATINPEFVMAARRDRKFLAVLNQADLCLADGVGLLWAARRAGYSLPERVTGSDALPLIAERAAREGWRLFFLGGADGIAARTADILMARFPGLVVAGTYSGSPAATEADAIVDMVGSAAPDVLFVAYGAPAQDIWIANHRRRLGVPVMMGVGGAFDHLCGVQRRAPAWIQNLGAEWLFRLVTQPWRWRRQLALPRFAWLVMTTQAVTPEWWNGVTGLLATGEESDGANG